VARVGTILLDGIRVIGDITVDEGGSDRAWSGEER
jgi:hypothetical protein